MEALASMGSNTYVVILSAIAAAVSFIAFAIPLMNRTEKKERYREVIEKKRKPTKTMPEAESEISIV